MRRFAGYIVSSMLPTKREFRRTLIDCDTPSDAMVLLKAMTRSTKMNTDELIDKLMSMYMIFEPFETSMRTLSMHQQRLEGSGGMEEFAVCTVLSAMMESIVASDARRRCAARASRDDLHYFRRSYQIDPTWRQHPPLRRASSF